METGAGTDETSTPTVTVDPTRVPFQYRRTLEPSNVRATCCQTFAWIRPLAEITVVPPTHANNWPAWVTSRCQLRAVAESARATTVANDDVWVPGRIHASAVSDDVCQAVLSATRTRDVVPLNEAPVPTGPATPNVTAVAAPLELVDPEPTAVAEPATSLSRQ